MVSISKTGFFPPLKRQNKEINFLPGIRRSKLLTFLIWSNRVAMGCHCCWYGHSLWLQQKQLTLLWILLTSAAYLCSPVPVMDVRFQYSICSISSKPQGKNIYWTVLLLYMALKLTASTQYSIATIVFTSGNLKTTI